MNLHKETSLSHLQDFTYVEAGCVCTHTGIGAVIGIKDSTVRFSIGLENIEDLLEDITQAINV